MSAGIVLFIQSLGLFVEMNIASQNFYKTLKESFEQNWPGYTAVASAVEVI